VPARLDDRWTYDGQPLIRIENRRIAACVVSTTGGNVLSLVDIENISLRPFDLCWGSHAALSVRAGCDSKYRQARAKSRMPVRDYSAPRASGIATRLSNREERGRVTSGSCPAPRQAPMHRTR